MNPLPWLVATYLGVTAPPPSIDCFDNCQISPAGLEMVMTFEGYSPFIYKDSAGLATIGFGHLIRPGEKFTQPFLPESAEELLQKDMKGTVRGVNRRVSIELRQARFDALCSFTFNLGEGALSGSTLLKRVNARRHEEVPFELMKWNKVRKNGVLVVVRGLTLRREAEATLYATEN